MNTVDKAALLTVAVLSTVTYIALKGKKKNGKPVRFLGLDPDNSIKLFAGVAIVSGAVLLLPTVTKTLKKV